MEKLKIIAYFLIVLCVSAFFHLNTFAAKLTHENAKEGNKSSDVENSFNYYEKAADSGDANAQYYVGKCYYDGKGVKQDYNRAFVYFKRAADKGHIDAQYNIGFCYAEGQGVKEDYNKAFEYWKKAADKGNADAQYNLGFCYVGEWE